MTALCINVANFFLFQFISLKGSYILSCTYIHVRKNYVILLKILNKVMQNSKRIRCMHLCMRPASIPDYRMIPIIRHLQFSCTEHNIKFHFGTNPCNTKENRKFILELFRFFSFLNINYYNMDNIIAKENCINLHNHVFYYRNTSLTK